MTNRENYFISALVFTRVDFKKARLCMSPSEIITFVKGFVNFHLSLAWQMIRQIRIRFRELDEETDFLDVYLWTDRYEFWLILLWDFKILLPIAVCSEAESESRT